MKIVILAGGSGSRLWPLSRKNSPKQVQPFVDNETLLQKTYHRLRRGFEKKDIFLAIGQSHLPEVRRQLPELNRGHIIVEPLKRDTAAAIGLAATYFYFRNPREVMVTVHSDHFIENESDYLNTLKLVGRVAAEQSDYGVLVGVKPTYPETGYGYIKMNSEFFSVRGQKVYNVEQFVEKPDLKRARLYVSQWQYLWNPGYFTWRVDTLLSQYKQFLPEMYRAFVKINRAFGRFEFERVLSSEFEKIKPVAFDYGILEKASQLFVVPANFIFTDIGNWQAVKKVLSQTESENITKGLQVTVDSRNNLIYNFTKSVVATAGLRDMIIVATNEATLVCHQNNAQGVKQIVEKLKDLGLEKFL